MSEIILQGDENDINVTLSESMQSAVVGSINVNGTRLDRILVVETTLGQDGDVSVIPAEEIEIGIPIEFDKFISVDASQITKVCRTCLCEKPDMHSLFETWEVETVAEMLTSFAAVQLSFGDGLPESVCAECSELVGKCFAFKQLCERSESVLRCLVTQGHLQGMKHEPRFIINGHGNVVKTHIGNRESLEEKPTSYENKEEPTDYVEFLDDELQNSTSTKKIAEPNSEEKSTKGINKPHKTLSIMNNPTIVINPSARYKQDTKKRELNSRNNYISKTIIKATTKGRARSVRTLANLSKKYKDSVNRQFKTEDDILKPILKEECDKKPEMEEFSFTCSSCGKRFPDQRKLTRHERTHLEIKPFQCSICKKGFNESGDLTRHARKHARSTPPAEAGKHRVPCPQCHLAFSCEGDLRIHSSIHMATGERRVCHHCSKEFPTTLQLKRHVRIHLADKPHKCRICHKGFPEMGSLTRHFRRHTGETREKKHVCATCGKAYYDRHSLNIHERTHTGEKPWICCDCGRGFIDSRLLNSHMKTHSDLKPYSCPTCDMTFKHESTLTTHVRTHTGEKPYVCSVCGNAFVQSSNLSLHMRTHTREKPYGCEYCHKKFSSSSALTTHTRIHTGEKPYICKICDKRFARHDMTAHMRTHTGEKPFVCSVCEKRFTTPGQLQQHTRIHTGERPFTCTVCGKGCTTSSYLKKHMNKSHSIVTLPSVDNLSNIIHESTPKLEQSESLDNCEFITTDGHTAQLITDGHVINMANTLTLTSNTLNVVAVANANGELSITAANALNVATLTASGENVETIVTNTLVSEEKLFQFDPSMVRIHHLTGNIIHSGQLTISELTNSP